MVTKEEVSVLRKAWRAFYNKWNKENEEWQDQAIWKGVIAKLQADRTKNIYVKECKKFFAFIDETPDQVYRNRLEHMSSKDPNVRATYEDKLAELKV